MLKGLSIQYENNVLQVLDQTQLPHQEKWIDVKTPEQMYDVIKALKVRGAPLIGVSAGLSLSLYAQSGVSKEAFIKAAEYLRSARPTAVNLMYVVDRLIEQAKKDYRPEAIEQEAVAIFKEDVELCERIAKHGAELIEDGDQILTHCNTGGLATAGVGTALGVLQMAHNQGKKIHVFVDETRPLLQGGRLTTWELEKYNIPYTLICDNMAAHLMKKNKITKAIVGADRIALNGDFANKIGTYSVALACKAHGLPFYIAAPMTTVDKGCVHGDDIEIEQRNPLEVRGVAGSFGQVVWAPEKACVNNPAFDVTPAELVTAWVLDTGVFHTANFV